MGRIRWKNGFRKWIIVTLALIIMVSGLVLNGKSVSACDYGVGSIINPHPDSKVFIGKVLEVRLHNENGPMGKDVFFEVQKVGQGDVKALKKVWTPYAEYSCGANFEVGETYYVITIRSKIISTSFDQAYVTTAKRINPEDASQYIKNNEKVEGQDLLDNFRRRSKASVSMQGEDIAATVQNGDCYVNKDNRVMVPLTDAWMNKFGIQYDISGGGIDVAVWTDEDLKYAYRLGYGIFQFDGQEKFMDTVIERYDGITYVPAQQLAEITHTGLYWDNVRKRMDFLMQ